MRSLCTLTLAPLPPPRPLLGEGWRLARAVPHAQGLTAVAIPDSYPYPRHPPHLSGGEKINMKDMHFVVSNSTQGKYLTRYNGRLTEHLTESQKVRKD